VPRGGADFEIAMRALVVSSRSPPVDLGDGQASSPLGAIDGRGHPHRRICWSGSGSALPALSSSPAAATLAQEKRQKPLNTVESML